MWAVIVRVEPPPGSWCRAATARARGVSVRVTSCVPVGGTTLVETVELAGEGWRDVLQDLQAGRADRVEVLDESPNGAVVRLAVPSCGLRAAIEASGVAPDFPFDVEDGTDRWLVVAPRERARAFVDALGRAGMRARVEFSGEYAPARPLTPRQSEVLHAAVDAGYYDFPRRTSLSLLAERLGVAKSTLSELLMIVEREVVGGLVTGERRGLPPPRGAR